MMVAYDLKKLRIATMCALSEMGIGRLRIETVVAVMPFALAHKHFGMVTRGIEKTSAVVGRSGRLPGDMVHSLIHAVTIGESIAAKVAAQMRQCRQDYTDLMLEGARMGTCGL